MTDTTPPDDPPLASHDEQPPDDEAPAVIHRQLSDAGIHLNEAQAHLAAIRTQAARSDLSAEVARVEAQALVQSLEESRDWIDEAIERAESLAPSEEPEPESDTTEPPNEGGQPDRTGDEDHDEGGPTMLWNTIHVDAPSEAK